MSLQRKGITLVEVMIAMVIFSLLMTCIVALFVNGYRSYLKGTNSTFIFRSTSIAFGSIVREIAQCERIYSPSGGAMTRDSLINGYIPVTGQNTPFIFVKYDNATEADQVLAYVLDLRTQTLMRMIYSPSFDPNDSTTWDVQSNERVASSVESIAFKLILHPPQPEQLMEIRLGSSSNSGNFQMQSEVRIHGGL